MPRHISVYEDQEAEFAKELVELPTTLGSAVVKAIAEANFIEHLEKA